MIFWIFEANEAAPSENACCAEDSAVEEKEIKYGTSFTIKDRS